MTSAADDDDLDFDHLKVVSEDEEDAEAAATSDSAAASGGGWRGRISSFLRNRRLGRLVRVRRAEKLREEAMFYGGGEVEEVRDDKGKRKRSKEPKKDSNNKSSIVCLGYRYVDKTSLDLLRLTFVSFYGVVTKVFCLLTD